MKTRLSVALTLLATVACGGGNGVTGPRVTPDNVVEVTLEQAAETLPENRGPGDRTHRTAGGSAQGGPGVP